MSKLSKFFGGSNQLSGSTTLTTGGNTVSNNTISNGAQAVGITANPTFSPIRVDASGMITSTTNVPPTTIKDIHFGDVVAIQEAEFFKDIVGHVIDIQGDAYCVSYTIRFEKNGIKHERAFDHANIRKLKATEYMKLKKEGKND